MAGQAVDIVPRILNFGNVAELTSSPTQQVQVLNHGTDPNLYLTIAPTDPRFSITPSGDLVIPRGTNPFLTVQFNATAVLGSASSTYASFTGFSPPFSAFVLNATTVPTGATVWNITPALIDFGTLQIGETTGNTVVTIHNTGTVDLIIESIVAGGTEFTLSSLPTFPHTIPAGTTLSFDVDCNAQFRGINDYPAGIVVTPSSGPPQSVELTYTGFVIVPAFTLTGATQGVLFGLAGTWDNAALATIPQALANLQCEAAAYWVKQYDFNNPGANTYMNKVFVRNEPTARPVTVTLTDTSRISGSVATATSTTTQPMDDGTGLLTWMQFDLENNGESHKITFSQAANSGILIMDMVILEYEMRGPVYEGK